MLSLCFIFFIKKYYNDVKQSRRSNKEQTDFDNKRLKKIRNDFNDLRDRFSKPQIKEIRKNLYDIKTKKTFLSQK